MSTRNVNAPDLLVRHEANPVLCHSQWPYPVNTIFNAGATRLPTGETLLLCRVEDREGRSHFGTARSADGLTGWTIDVTPALLPDDVNHPEECWGIEDPRVVWVPELGKYAITYTCYGRAGPGVCLALTTDFRKYERIGNIFVPENKDAALVPRRVDGQWAIIHRPVWSGGPAHIWMSLSPDLYHWGGHTLLLNARHGPWWDAGKVGLCTPLIETAEGWLMTYHGVKWTVAGSLYRVGIALLDRDDPRRCIRRGKQWIFTPQTDYELTGDVGNVVFPCGCTIEDDGDTLRLYYGAADSAVAVATASIHRLLEWLRSNSHVSGIAPS